MDTLWNQQSSRLRPALNNKHKRISCSNISKVINHAVDDLTITIESGLSICELQALLAEKGNGFRLIGPETRKAA